MDIEKKRKENMNSTEVRVRKSSSWIFRCAEIRRVVLELVRKDFGKVLKYAAIRSYFRPRSHRVEVAASGDPRTNGDSTLYYFYYYQESKATGRPPLPTNSSLQTLKLQPHASPHLGTDLRIAQLSNIGSFDHHLSTTDRAFATNAGTQNRIYRSHNTYASIPEILTRVC
ncbi:hypothetical protein V1477_016098 [Vespula maculifrons]|uniref:Uncharacterized protein n=1 Tax=Vespula maculifrons TaxID=7453 RepID=A0ABD2BC21_VESMC